MVEQLFAYPSLWLAAVLVLFSLIESGAEAGGDPGQRVTANFVTWLVSVGLTAGGALALGALAPWPAGPRLLGGTPPLANTAYVVVLSLVAYWFHRANHRWPLLWRFHRVHHSDPGLDATTTLRTHPVEYALAALIQLALARLLGAGAAVVLGYAVVSMSWAVFTHAAIRLPDLGVPRPLRWLASPAFHRVHHSAARMQADANYAGMFAVWDLLFGTYRAPGSEPVERIGLGEAFDRRGGWKDQLLLPMVAVETN
jgi:sterol desaturase/sphingolipid hydroxylase (fatty acid hydroxylase superfamily)